MNNFNNNILIIVGIFLLIILTLGVINYFGINLPYISLIEKSLFNVMNPIIEGVHNINSGINNYFIRFNKTDEIIEENQKLKKELANERLENLLLEKYKRQNERLKSLLDFKELISYETTGAEVIGFGPSEWEKKLLINKGENDGLKEGMTVITYNGTFVGQIDYIATNSAQVRLVNDPDFIVAGIVQREDSRAVGLVKGTLEENEFNIMDNLSWEADIKKDDLILTSGLSNTYPKGLPIGKVVEVSSDNYGVSQKAKIDLFLDLKTIEEVLVINNF